MKFLSLFSGIEAASVAWKPLGWECAAVAEIEAFPCAVLKHHYPTVPNLGDVTAVTKEQIEALGKIDVVVLGFPCQDVSIAGKQKGLKNADGSLTRTGLFYIALQIIEWANPRLVIGENVPGLFSTNGGSDFASVVGELAGSEIDLPRDGWRNAGVALGPKGLVEWFVLDAQYVRVESHPRAVPQRRRRVFFVRDSGDWQRRPPLLLVPQSLRGNPPPRREAGKNSSPTLAARTRGGGGLGTDFDCDGGLIAHSLRAEGLDASEDGTGRATPLIATAFAENSRAEIRLCGGDGNVSSQLTTGGGKPGQGRACVAIQAGALRENPESGPDGVGVRDDGAAYTIEARSEVQAVMTLAIRGRGDSHQLETRSDGTSNAILTPNGGRGGIGVGAIATRTAVRRLTPLECERLQGFPDGYTAIPYRGKPAADGPRYKALGNSMAVNVMRWIGERIQHLNSLPPTP